MDFLIVENDEATWRSLEWNIQSYFASAKFDRAVDEPSALRVIGDHPCDLVIMDSHLDNGSYGPRIVKLLRGLGYAGVIVMNTSDPASLQEGLDAGANAGFLKPHIQLEEILRFMHLIP